MGARERGEGGQGGDSRAAAPLSEATLAILDAVDAVPHGRAVSYSEIARVAGVAPRQVGHVLARFGHEVPWHRVVMASGKPARHLATEQLARLREEGVPLVADGSGVDLGAARPS